MFSACVRCPFLFFFFLNKKISALWRGCVHPCRACVSPHCTQTDRRRHKCPSGFCALSLLSRYANNFYFGFLALLTLTFTFTFLVFCLLSFVCGSRSTASANSGTIPKALPDQQRSLPLMIVFFDWDPCDPEQSARSNQTPDREPCTHNALSCLFWRTDFYSPE